MSANNKSGIAIQEQTVVTETMQGADYAYGILVCDVEAINENELLVTFNGVDYKVQKNELPENAGFYFGELDSSSESGTIEPIFDNYPFCIVGNIAQNIAMLSTQNSGSYIISAKVSGPKVLTFSKGRTISSELSRINKAFGKECKSQNIVDQISALADAAKSGMIGGGADPLVVHGTISQMSTYSLITADKTAGEIIEALKNAQLVMFTYSYENEETEATIIEYIYIVSTFTETQTGKTGYDFQLDGPTGEYTRIQAYELDEYPSYKKYNSES